MNNATHHFTTSMGSRSITRQAEYAPDPLVQFQISAETLRRTRKILDRIAPLREPTIFHSPCESKEQHEAKWDARERAKRIRARLYDRVFAHCKRRAVQRLGGAA